MIYKNSERMRDFLGLFIFIVVLVFYILGAFLIKQLFHSHLLDMRWSIISYPTRAHGIIVKYPARRRVIRLYQGPQQSFFSAAFLASGSGGLLSGVTVLFT